MKGEIEMKIIKNKEFLRSVAQHLDLMNTVSGGVSDTYVMLDQKKKGAVLRVMTPSVQPERLHVLLDGHMLTVYSELHHEENPELQVPMFYRAFRLPGNVNLDQVKAVYTDGELQVRLPYYPKGPRQIEIEQL